MKKIKVSQAAWEAVDEEGRKMAIDYLCSQGLMDTGEVVVPDPDIDAPFYNRDHTKDYKSSKKGSHEDCVDKCFDAAVLTLALCEAHGGHPDHCEIAADKVYSKCVEHC